MNVKELIELLKKYNENMEVVSYDGFNRYYVNEELISIKKLDKELETEKSKDEYKKYYIVIGESND